MELPLRISSGAGDSSHKKLDANKTAKLKGEVAQAMAKINKEKQSANQAAKALKERIAKPENSNPKAKAKAKGRAKAKVTPKPKAKKGRKA